MRSCHSQHDMAAQEDIALSMGGAGDTVSAEVERIYGALLHGPKKQAPTEGMRLPLRTPQGTKALSEAIHALLEGHVEYIHQAHHHLIPVRLSELSGNILGMLVLRTQIIHYGLSRCLISAPCHVFQG